jgi:hypothetical protein
MTHDTPAPGLSRRNTFLLMYGNILRSFIRNMVGHVISRLDVVPDDYRNVSLWEHSISVTTFSKIRRFVANNTKPLVPNVTTKGRYVLIWRSPEAEYATVVVPNDGTRSNETRCCKAAQDVFSSVAVGGD